MAEHKLAAVDIASGELCAPPLIQRLIGRQPTAHMAVSYARLCFGYSAASMLLDGDVKVDCYDDDKLFDTQRIALAKRFTVISDGSSDPNAMTPQTLTITLHNGQQHSLFLPATLGSPQRPLTRQQHLDKFRQCCASAAFPLSKERTEALISFVDSLECASDVGQLLALSTGSEK